VRLTARIVLLSTAVMAFVLGGVALLTYELVGAADRDDVDRLLRDEAAAVADAFADEARTLDGLDGVLSPPELARAAQFALTIHPSGARHVVVMTLADRRLQSAGGPRGLLTLARSAERPPIRAGALRSVDTTAGPVRVLDVEVLDANGATLATVTTMASLDDARDTANSVLRLVIVASVVGLVVGALVLAVVMRRALRGLRQVSAATAGVTSDELGARVPVPAPDDEVAELAREINGMLERIDAADATRRQYLAAISHEVRTPLAVAEGHLELLSMSSDDPAVAATSLTVRGELERLRRVLDDLMAVARGHGQVDIRLGPVFLPDLFESIAERIVALDSADRVSIDEAPPVVILADQARVEQCIANLVDNAITHNDADTRVTLSARLGSARLGSVRSGSVRSGEDVVELVVSDTGGGIDPSVRGRVVEPFVTTRPTGDRRATGLGLAVVDSLTRAQDGALTIDTGPDGTTITIALPRDQPDH
jgi:two-component system OmpR family sensor kinase